MKRLLLAASALAVLAGPAASLAQPADQRDMRQDQRQDNRQDRRQDMRPDRDQDMRQDRRQDMRQDRRVWNRNDRFWWRGRPEFRDYAGVRPGQWFIPGRGYVRPIPGYYNYAWRVGGFVPFALRSYVVFDPYVYGLPPAPPAFRYVFVGNGTIALINRFNGKIVRVYPGFY